MLRGPSKITLDSKGRLALPTRYREAVLARCEGQFVATIDRDPCLLLYPLPDWEDVERRLMRLPANNRAARAFQRRMVGHAVEMEMDSHGRILIAKELRDIAGLEKQVMLVGLGNKFEIWDEGRWNEYLGASEADIAELPEALESIRL